MPNQYGDPTPQEILQSVIQNRDRIIARAGNNPQAQRNAIMYAMGQTLSATRSPEYIKAKEIDSAIKGSMALERGEDESAIDYEIRKGRDLYGRVRDLDSNTAFQVAERILTLEEEKKQQARLMAQDARAERQDERNEEMHAGQMEAMRQNAAVRRSEGIRYGFNGEKRTIVPGLWTHVDDPAAQMEIAGWAEKGITPITPDQAFALKLDTSDSDKKILGSHHGKHIETATAFVDSAILGREIIRGFGDAIEASINPTASVRPVMNTLQSVSNSLEEVRRMANLDDEGRLDANYVPTPTPGSPEFEKETKRVSDALNQYGIKTAVPHSLLTLYIYSVAKAQDARVTNMDYETIAKTVSDVAGNPEQTFEQMKAQLQLRQEGLTRTLRNLANTLVSTNAEDTEGYFQGQTILSVLNEGDKVYDEFLQQGDRMKSIGVRRQPISTPSGQVYHDSDFEVSE